jgi:hypothetical protein
MSEDGGVMVKEGKKATAPVSAKEMDMEIKRRYVSCQETPLLLKD